MTSLLQELDNMRKNELSEREDQWNSHLDGLTSDHNNALSEASELGKDLQQVFDGNDLLKVQVHTLSLSQSKNRKCLMFLFSACN